MEYLICKNSEGELVGFAPASDNPKIPDTADPCRVFTAEIASSITLNADANDVYWLYEVCFSDFSSVFVTAFDFSDALVTALLRCGEGLAPFYVYEYDLFELRESGKSGVTIYEFDTKPSALLSVLNDKNRDLVAHAIAFANGCTEEELRGAESDYIEKALGVAGKTGTELSTDEILSACSYVWNNYILFESTDASAEVRRLHARHSAEADPVALLMWTFVFEQWAHYDCHLPYTLYRLLLDGGFDGCIDGFIAERGILE